MKLKEFNPANSVTVRAKISVPAILRVSTKSGLFVFNRPASDLIGLTNKDKVLLHQDEEEPENWYVEIVKGDGFPVRPNSKKTEFKFNSVFVARKISESVSFTGSTGRMLIAGTATELGKRKLWGILTVSLKNY